MDNSFGNNVIVEITDMSGKLVKQLRGQTINRALSVDGRDLADGAYMVKVVSGNKHAVAPMMIAK
ncbi:MAG: T9SS type A sorting domain-containing protein [Sphingomonadales bacterium]